MSTFPNGYLDFNSVSVVLNTMGMNDISIFFHTKQFHTYFICTNMALIINSFTTHLVKRRSKSGSIPRNSLYHCYGGL